MRQAAIAFNVPKTTLLRKAREKLDSTVAAVNADGDVTYRSTLGRKPIFTPAQEATLVEYCLELEIRFTEDRLENLGVPIRCPKRNSKPVSK